MGRASDPLQQFKRTLEGGHLEEAMRMAKPLAISDYDSMRLTILAAVRRSPLYDRMAAKWIVRVTTKRKLKLSELAWLVQRFEEAKHGDGSRAEKALVRFLGEGWDMPH